VAYGTWDRVSRDCRTTGCGGVRTRSRRVPYIYRCDWGAIGRSKRPLCLGDEASTDLTHILRLRFDRRRVAHVRVMSALPPKADIGTQLRDVRFVPKADISRDSEIIG